jgi:hypothetical protein
MLNQPLVIIRRASGIAMAFAIAGHHGFGGDWLLAFQTSVSIFVWPSFSGSQTFSCPDKWTEWVSAE